ncbi:MAG: hypothetical protein ACI4XM_03295 [Candidatus Coprovivens sp.]
MLLSGYIDNYNHKELIYSSNSSFSGEYIGAMYKANISDEYKAVYSINEYLNKNNIQYLFDKVSTGEEVEFEISLNGLNKMVSTFFANTEIKEGFKTDGYKNVYGINCEKEICKIKIWGYGGTGPQPTYSSHLVSEKYNKKTNSYEYIVSSYYIIVEKNGVGIYTEKMENV